MTEAERIEKDAREFTKGWGENCDLKSYIAGAKAEHERLQQQSYDQCEIISHLEQQIAQLTEEKENMHSAHCRMLERRDNELKLAQELNREVVRALEAGELELRTIYERHTSYKSSTPLWLMQEVLKKYNHDGSRTNI